MLQKLLARAMPPIHSSARTFGSDAEVREYLENRTRYINQSRKTRMGKVAPILPFYATIRELFA